MKANFDGQDYYLWLDYKKGELFSLKKQKIEAPLFHMHEGTDLNKKVTLEFGENDAIDGIQFEYLPKKHSGWDSIKEIYVKINQWAYNHVSQRGSFGTRYNGSDKIEIFNGDPDEIMRSF